MRWRSWGDCPGPLADNENIPHLWLSDDEAAGKHDFDISGIKVGAKTVKRQVPMRPHYTAQITAQHAKEPIDHFFFMCFEVPRKVMWLLGGITKEDFLV